MKIKLEDKLRTLDGTPLQDVDKSGKPVEIIVRMVMIESLLRPHPSEDRLGGIEKLRRFELARKIHEAKDEIDLPVEDVALLKELIGIKNFPVLIVGQMFRLLDSSK